MNDRNTIMKLLAAVLALLLLAGCGAAGPEPTDAPEVSAAPAATAEPVVTPAPEPEAEVVRVSTVDEFLDAVAPHTTILLSAGTYDLSTASNYGKPSNSGCYAWVSAVDGFSLEFHNLEGLSILGEGADRVTISAVPRYANVLQFVSCRDVTVAELTAGHTKEPGFCCGGVLSFERCSGCTVRQCGLFGCGTVGVQAVDSTALRVEDTAVYECSYNALSLVSCEDVRVTGGEVYRCGRREEDARASSLFDIQDSSGVCIAGLSVRDNYAELLLRGDHSPGILFLSNTVKDNDFAVLLSPQRFAPIVDGCLFADNVLQFWYLNPEGVKAVDTDGRELAQEELAAMALREIDPDSVSAAAFGPAAALDVAPGAEVTVTTVDEFLAAIGPERTIVLDGALFDLSAASGYGVGGGLYYYWQETYDGPELVIDSVKGLTIKAAADDPKATTLSAVPRYADVLSFTNCEDLALIGFTAGHTKEPGFCAGGVLTLADCSGITLDGMRLYGCGILGVEASWCSAFKLIDTEIYECSDGGVQMYYTNGIEFTGCSIRDVPSPALCLVVCGDVSWNGEPLTAEYYDMEDGAPVEVRSYAVG
ncbi:MAG: right-handed parallel beta-helix repeat-containing protein [Oscillospiraceae bacterium]|nr:right-handed parallel beta-helix repeat-containing protein [Oscillospiraceae bacterium]